MMIRQDEKNNNIVDNINNIVDDNNNIDSGGTVIRMGEARYGRNDSDYNLVL